MKNYFYRYVFKGLILTLFLAVPISLFAINFNEPRKVIVPQYANAVYRDLTVLDKMYFETEADSSRTFLLELGKRPSYFWDADKKFHLFENLKLQLGDVAYNNSDTNKNILMISNMNLDEGSFVSEKIFLNGNSSVTINNSSSNLLINYKGNLPVHLHFGKESIHYNIYSLLLGYGVGNGSVEAVHKVSSLYLRDLKFSGTGYNGSTGVKFRSPRMMIYFTGSQYRANGTALNFELYSPVVSSSKAKNWYGEWNLYNNGVLKSPGQNPCGNSQEKVCKKKKCTANQRGSGTCITIEDNDHLTNVFTCEGKKFEQGSESGTYDPNDLCYDYKEETIYNDNMYNNSNAFYEFKVEEIYNINERGNASLVSQTPKVKVVSAAYKTVVSPFYSYTNSNWSLSGSGTFLIDGQAVSDVSVKNLPYGYADNPCFKGCGGGLCGDNIVYVKDTNTRELKGSDDTINYWPASDGGKQHLVLRTYTMVYCPKRLNKGGDNNNNSYGEYEDNLPSDQQKLVDALLIQTSTDYWATASVCMRRAVRCNVIDEKKYNRTYTLLSTDR